MIASLVTDLQIRDQSILGLTENAILESKTLYHPLSSSKTMNTLRGAIKKLLMLINLLLVHPVSSS